MYDRESDQLAAELIRQACEREGIDRSGLVVHSDNGPAMKGKTLLAAMQTLGIVPSFSRSRAFCIAATNVVPCERAMPSGRSDKIGALCGSVNRTCCSSH